MRMSAEERREWDALQVADAMLDSTQWERAEQRREEAREHVLLRAEQRYGLQLADADVAHLERTIQRKEALLVRSLGLRREVWVVYLAPNHFFPVFYEPALQLITTILPPTPLRFTEVRDRFKAFKRDYFRWQRAGGPPPSWWQLPGVHPVTLRDHLMRPVRRRG